jgi:hypothetical protein
VPLRHGLRHGPVKLLSVDANTPLFVGFSTIHSIYNRRKLFRCAKVVASGFRTCHTSGWSTPLPAHQLVPQVVTSACSLCYTVFSYPGRQLLAESQSYPSDHAANTGCLWTPVCKSACADPRHIPINVFVVKISSRHSESSLAGHTHGMGQWMSLFWNYWFPNHEYKLVMVSSGADVQVLHMFFTLSILSFCRSFAQTQLGTRAPLFLTPTGSPLTSNAWHSTSNLMQQPTCALTGWAGQCG